MQCDTGSGKFHLSYRVLSPQPKRNNKMKNLILIAMLVLLDSQTALAIVDVPNVPADKTPKLIKMFHEQVKIPAATSKSDSMWPAWNFACGAGSSFCIRGIDAVSIFNEMRFAKDEDLESKNLWNVQEFERLEADLVARGYLNKTPKADERYELGFAFHRKDRSPEGNGYVYEVSFSRHFVGKVKAETVPSNKKGSVYLHGLVTIVCDSSDANCQLQNFSIFNSGTFWTPIVNPEDRGADSSAGGGKPSNK